MTDTGTPRTRAIAEVQEAASAAATPEVIVLPTLSDAARRACQDTVRILAAAVTDRGVAHLALTGGSGGMALSEALAPLITAQPEEVRRAIHLWFGDERFVPAGDPERNDLLATPLIAAGIRESQTHRLAAPNEVSGLDEAWPTSLSRRVSPTAASTSSTWGWDLTRTSAPSSPDTRPRSRRELPPWPCATRPNRLLSATP